jgi:hypothetical protein
LTCKVVLSRLKLDIFINLPVANAVALFRTFLAAYLMKQLSKAIAKVGE